MGYANGLEDQPRYPYYPPFWWPGYAPSSGGGTPDPDPGDGSGASAEEIVEGLKADEMFVLLFAAAARILAVPGPIDSPIISLPAPTNPEKAIVRFYLTDFSGAPLANQTITCTLKDKRVLALNGRFHRERFATGKTDADGMLDLELWIDTELLKNGLKPLYVVTGPGIPSNYTIRVKAGGGLAPDLKSDDEAPVAPPPSEEEPPEEDET